MNRKLKLSLDELSVESFHISRPDGQEGTVRAHGTGDWDVSCHSCGGSCVANCEVSAACPAPSDYGCNPDTWDDFSCYFTCQTCDDYTRVSEING